MITPVNPLRMILSISTPHILDLPANMSFGHFTESCCKPKASKASKTAREVAIVM